MQIARLHNKQEFAKDDNDVRLTQLRQTYYLACAGGGSSKAVRKAVTEEALNLFEPKGKNRVDSVSTKVTIAMQPTEVWEKVALMWTRLRCVPCQPLSTY